MLVVASQHSEEGLLGKETSNTKRKYYKKHKTFKYYLECFAQLKIRWN